MYGLRGVGDTPAVYHVINWKTAAHRQSDAAQRAVDLRHATEWVAGLGGRESGPKPGS